MRGHILNVMMLLWKRALSCGSELVKSCERRVLWLWDGSGVQVGDGEGCYMCAESSGNEAKVKYHSEDIKGRGRSCCQVKSIVTFISSTPHSPRPAIELRIVSE